MRKPALSVPRPVILRPAILCSGFLLSAAAAFAQNASDAAANVAGCALCSTFLFIPIIGLALGIALLVWVARDAKARGMDSAVLWMLLVFFTNLIGLIVYLLVRPQGNLVVCPNCGNKRLQTSVRCPHCGA
jgi:ribosomal protein S27E